MNVLSLFDGMSCGMIALERAGITVNNYYASEIDKYAIQVSAANYPGIVQIGDVTKVDGWFLPHKIDLLIGGSPCQGFSFAGKGLNFDDVRSKLFFEYVRILSEIRAENPDVKFLLENVKMKKEHQDVISEYLGCQPIMINSALVSAQNRRRLYWTNIPGAGQPEDRGVFLKDILEECPDSKYHISETMQRNLENWESRNAEKGNGFKMNVKNGDEKSSVLSTGAMKSSSYIKIGVDGKIKQNQEKAGCLTGGAHSGGNHSDMDLIVTGCDYRSDEGLRVREGSKSGTLSARARNDESCGQRVIMLDRIRRFTPIECECLQTVPDGYTESVSDTQRYKMLGNGWTIDVIAHIFKGLADEEFTKWLNS